MRAVFPLFFVCSMLSIPACVIDRQSEDDGSSGAVEQRDAWDQAGNPAVLGANLLRDVDKLPKSGKAQIVPWSGSEWRIQHDSINWRWAGPETDSASTKYQKAFGGSGIEDAVSLHHGIASLNGASCTDSSQCASPREVCAKREGRSAGRCVPTVRGLSRGWAAASLLVPEPQHPVTVNGVTFEVQDLKALASVAYARPNAVRVKTASDAAILHLLLTNIVGLRSTGFAVDRTYDGEVVSQPISGYTLEQSEIDVTTATQLTGVTEFPTAVKRWVKVSTQVDSIASQDDVTATVQYDYVLEVDRNGNVMGGEYCGESRDQHPDFAWFPTGKAPASVVGGAIRFAHVKDLLEASIDRADAGAN